MLQRNFKKCLKFLKEGSFKRHFWIWIFATKGLFKIFNLVSGFFKVNPKKIVASQFSGSDYADNPGAVFDYILKNNLDYELVWLTDCGRCRNPEKIPSGVRIVKHFSFRALKELSTAGIWIDNVRKEFFPTKKKNQIYIQTWHGSFALKKIERDAECGLTPNYIKLAKRDSKAIDVILSGCGEKSKIYKNSFWYDGEILEIGTPRTDIFFDEERMSDFRKSVFTDLNIGLEVKIALYAPTFRKNKKFDCYSIDYIGLETALKKRFSGSWKILVRFHPILKEYVQNKNLPPSIIDVTNFPDIQALLASCDAVISDYSGLVFDFYITKRPVFLFCTDIREYSAQDRGFYHSLTELPFAISESNEDLQRTIEKFNQDEYESKISAFNKKFNFYESGESCKKLIEWIERKQIENRSCR